MEAKSRNRTSREAFRLFVLEARNPVTDWPCTTWEGCWQTGWGGEIDPAGAQEWYVKALAAFLKEEKHTEEKQRPYLQYRIRQDVCRRSGNRTGL
ncbi:MAG: hypothetical protein ACLR0U_25615 [Enterocloster clostridioformis]